MSQRNGMLRTGDFGCVQPTINMDDGFAFFGERLGLGDGKFSGMRKQLRDFFVSFDMLRIFLGSNDGIIPRSAFGGFA